MDIGDQNDAESNGFGEEQTQPRPRALPDDLPKSLDDRKSVPVFTPETEMYDAWQGGFLARAWLPGFILINCRTVTVPYVAYRGQTAPI